MPSSIGSVGDMSGASVALIGAGWNADGSEGGPGWEKTGMGELDWRTGSK